MRPNGTDTRTHASVARNSSSSIIITRSNMRGSLSTQYSVQLIEYSNDWLIYENELLLLLLLFTTKPVCVCVL